MLIKSVDVVKIEVPLSRPYVIARGVTHSFKQVLVFVNGEDGTVGVGECALYSVVGDWDSAHHRLLEFGQAIRGMDSWDLEAILDRLNVERQPDLAPVAAIDMALWDLNGKAVGQPVYRLLGGLGTRRCAVDYTLSQDEPGAMARMALRMAEAGGFHGFCVKVGGSHATVEADVTRVREVRAALGSSFTIRLDANGGYRPDEAIALLRGVERYDIEFAEQPVAAGDLDGLKRVFEATQARISIDEGVCRPSDVLLHANTGAVAVFNIKIPKCGGLQLSRKVAAVAESAGIPCICGGALSLEVARQASRHFASGVRLGQSDMCQEGPGPASQALVGNVTAAVVGYEDVRAKGGAVEIGDEPGLGVQPDLESIARFLVG